MSWVTLALGLIREAATTELGQDIIRDLRSSKSSQKKRSAPTDAQQVAAWRNAVDERISVVDRNIEMLVQMLNSQDETFIRIQKRQRIWNLVLSGAILAALIAVAVLALT